MTISKDNKPTTLNAAIKRLTASLNEVEREYIRRSEPCTVHHTAGQSLRNNWDLWNTKSAININIQNRFGLCHGDDCSGLLLAGVWATVLGQDVEAALIAQAKRYRAHWRKHGTDPMAFKLVRAREAGE